MDETFVGKCLSFMLVLGSVSVILNICLRDDESALNLPRRKTLAADPSWVDTRPSKERHAIQETQDYDPDPAEQGLARSLIYCNSMKDGAHGSEGKGPPGFHLVHVHLFIRHGDRSPMYTLPNHKAPALSCSLSDIRTPEVSEFIAAMVKLKASLPPGSPLHRFHLYPNAKSCAGATLTGQGAVQLLHVGQHLHSAYIKGRQLVKANETGAVFVRCSDYSRTFQSLVALLYGLIPDNDLTKLRMDFVQSILMCSEVTSGQPCHCPAAKDLHASIKKEERRRSANDSSIRTIKADIGQALSASPLKLPWVSAILEVLMTHTCHDLDLPCLNQSCVSMATVNRMWQHLDKEGLRRTSSYANHHRDRLNMHPLLLEVVNRLLELTRGMTKNRLAIYSGHDLTLTPLLQILGIYDGRWAPYASRLAIETWRNEGGDHFTRVVFNGEDKTHSLRLCNEEELVQGLCPLDKLIYFVRYKDIQFFGKSSYAEACKR